MVWYQRYERVMFRFLFLVILAFGVVAIPKAWGQVKIQSFELNKPLKEQVTLCMDKAAAEEIVDAFVKYGDETDLAKKKEAAMNAMAMVDVMHGTGACADLPVIIVYRSLIKEHSTKDGHYLTVYEADVQGHTVYVPLVDFKHHRVES